MLQFILGIDAAWTAHHSAGVALVKMPARGRPQLLRVARSYEEFCQLAADDKIDWAARVRGSSPDIPTVLAVCQKICGALPNVIALDIPLGPQPINGRRTADRLVTKTYITRKAGTHSPTAQRPGPISLILFEQLTHGGFEWLHAEAPSRQKRNSRVFIEVYPHPAIIELLGLKERLKYKVSKLQKYWPELDRAQRRIAVVKNLNGLRSALNKRVAGVAQWLPAAQSFTQASSLKGYEDALDAVVCAWIGCEFLAGRSVAYGDAKSAIWLPKPSGLKHGRHYTNVKTPEI